jgi:Domain of unknown function (DUF5615)
VSELRFDLDENVPTEVGTQLRSSGIDAVTARDLGSLGAADQDHLERATAQSRMLCTHDQDFLRLAAAGTEHAGIAFSSQTRVSFRQPDLAHQAATASVPALRNALDDYHEAGRAAARAQGLASTIRESLPELRGQLVQLGRTIQRAEQAMKGPEKAIEAIVSEVGLQGARLAFSALPPVCHLPVELAIRAVERVLDPWARAWPLIREAAKPTGRTAY